MEKNQRKTPKTTLGQFIRALFSKETPAYIKLIVSMAVVYTIFPMDILPDFLGVVGLVDDAALVTILTTVSMTLLDHHNKPMRTFRPSEEAD